MERLEYMDTANEELDLIDKLKRRLSLPEGEDIRCVFSTVVERAADSGAAVLKEHVFIEGTGDNQFAVRSLNKLHLPVGEVELVTLEELVTKYVPEVAFFEAKTIPAMEVLEGHLDEGDAQREEGQLYGAEQSYNKARSMDEHNVRALFSLGLLYLDMKDKDRACEMMDSLLEIRTTFVGNNQHLFNEFGISLRKAGLYDEAVKYYTKATEFVRNDENLFYNIARANYERNDWIECVNALGVCFSIDREMKLSSAMFTMILRMDRDPKLCEKLGKPPIPKAAIDHIREIYRGEDPYLVELEAKQKAAEAPEVQVDQIEEELGRARSGKKKSTPTKQYSFDLD